MSAVLGVRTGPERAGRESDRRFAAFFLLVTGEQVEALIDSCLEFNLVELPTLLERYRPPQR